MKNCPPDPLAMDGVYYQLNASGVQPFPILSFRLRLPALVRASDLMIDTNLGMALLPGCGFLLHSTWEEWG